MSENPWDHRGLGVKARRRDEVIRRPSLPDAARRLDDQPRLIRDHEPPAHLRPDRAAGETDVGPGDAHGTPRAGPMPADVPMHRDAFRAHQSVLSSAYFDHLAGHGGMRQG